jgi:hypothetical protein
MCDSTCFGRLPAHHHEHTAALGAIGFTVGEWRLERCWSWSARLAVYEIMWKNIVEPGRPQMTIRRMRIACWLIVLHILGMCNTYCFATATTVTQTRIKVTLYVHYLSCLSPCQTFWGKTHRVHVLYTCKRIERSVTCIFFAEYVIKPQQWKQ